MPAIAASALSAVPFPSSFDSSAALLIMRMVALLLLCVFTLLRFALLGFTLRRRRLDLCHRRLRRRVHLCRFFFFLTRFLQHRLFFFLRSAACFFFCFYLLGLVVTTFHDRFFGAIACSGFYDAFAFAGLVIGRIGFPFTCSNRLF